MRKYLSGIFIVFVIIAWIFTYITGNSFAASTEDNNWATTATPRLLGCAADSRRRHRHPCAHGERFRTQRRRADAVGGRPEPRGDRLRRRAGIRRRREDHRRAGCSENGRHRLPVRYGRYLDVADRLTVQGLEGREHFRSATPMTGGDIFTGGDGGLGSRPTAVRPPRTSTRPTGCTRSRSSTPACSTRSRTRCRATSTKSGPAGPETRRPRAVRRPTAPSSRATNLPPHFDPDQFAFVNLGTGNGPDTLYVADGARGATCGGDNDLEVLARVGRLDRHRLHHLAAPGDGPGRRRHHHRSGREGGERLRHPATSTSAQFNTVLSRFTDTSGYEGTLTGSFTQLATAPTGDDSRSGLRSGDRASEQRRLPGSTPCPGAPDSRWSDPGRRRLLGRRRRRTTPAQAVAP